MFWRLIGQTLALNQAAFTTIQTLPNGFIIALLVVFLASLSEAIGQSIVLLANRVKPKRFVLSLLLSAGIQVFGLLFWTLSIWLVGTQFFAASVRPAEVTRAVALGYSPYLFSFFTLVPFFGSLINALLSLWRLSAVILAVDVVLDLSVRQAVLCSGLGWLLLQVLKSTIGRPIIGLTRVLRRYVAGVELTKLKVLLEQLQYGQGRNLPTARQRTDTSTMSSSTSMSTSSNSTTSTTETSTSTKSTTETDASDETATNNLSTNNTKNNTNEKKS